MSNETNQSNGVSRRTVLKASTLATGAFALGGPASAHEEWREGPKKDSDNDVDEPVGFSGEVIAAHGTFADAVTANFGITYAEGDMGTQEVAMDDASTIVVAKLLWEPGGTSGWHTHPGPVIWSVTEGDLHVVNEDDGVTRTYTAGEVGLSRGQGNTHNVTNPSQTEPAATYATFFGVPDGGELTKWVAPVDVGSTDVDLGSMG